MAKIVVCGGRSFADDDVVADFLDGVHTDTPLQTIFHPACFELSKIIERWCEDNNVECVGCKADQKRWGKTASQRRNIHMIKHKPDAVVVFPGDGTHHMISTADRFKIPVIFVEGGGD